ncbi:MAG TPA: hypothetical protein VF198_01805 [Vicinamibacterales bacterium]
MKRAQLWAAVAGVVLVAVAVVWFARRDAAGEGIALLDRLDAAQKRTNVESPDQFAVGEVTIGGESRRAILALPHSRLIWQVSVPAGGWMEVAFALTPDAWENAEGADGVQFRIGVSDGRIYDELLRQVVDPARDRRWFTARLDLAAYEGRTVDVIFNTDPGPPGSTNTRNDRAVWGEPRIYTRP